MLKRVASIALALCALAALPARADTVLLSTTSLVIGSQSASYSFQAPGAGTVVAQVTNIDWPQHLGSLNFVAGSANQVMASWADPPSQTSNTLSFDVTGPGMYFANILASASGPLDLGLYSLSIKFVPTASAVPLPAAVWELLTGLLVVIAWLRLAPARWAAPAHPAG